MFKPEFITRHYDLITPGSLEKKIIIVGAGAIGSFVTLSLAKMGYSNLHVYDYDTVEPENIGAQFFSIDSIGKKKVMALAEMVWNFTGIKIHTYDQKVTDSDKLTASIVIAAVDNMAVRKMLFESVRTDWLIDPRMGAEYATMNTVNFLGTSADIAAYARTLFADSDAVQERCTAKTTIYTVLLIAGQVVKAVKDITNGNGDKRISSLEWSIRDNSMLAFSNGKRL